MKTCSFRFARPRSLNEGLFCLQDPEARYELAACGNCGLCYPQYDMTHRLNKFVVKFNQAHRHRFVNGYEAILNCSAVGPTNGERDLRLLSHCSHVIHVILFMHSHVPAATWTTLVQRCKVYMIVYNVSIACSY